jgi:hypothetical protein
MIPQRTTATHKVIDFLTKRKLHFDKVLEYPHAKGGLIVWVCTNTKTIKNFKPIVWMTDEFVIVYVYYPNINILYEMMLVEPRLMVLVTCMIITFFILTRKKDLC